jgi:hypothetical protein
LVKVASASDDLARIGAESESSAARAARGTALDAMAIANSARAARLLK